MEGFVATGKQKHGERRKACPRGPLPRAVSRVERVERKLETKAGAAVYATREFIVGKSNRHAGSGSFSYVGSKK
jgi:hypothetical protein